MSEHKPIPEKYIVIPALILAAVVAAWFIGIMISHLPEPKQTPMPPQKPVVERVSKEVGKASVQAIRGFKEGWKEEKTNEKP